MISNKDALRGMRPDITHKVDELHEAHMRILKTTKDLESTGFIESEIDDRSFQSSSFLWRYLKHPRNQSRSTEKGPANFQLFPERSIVALLDSGQQITRHASHVTIARLEDNKLSFCISGQVSLDELKSLHEQLLSDKHRKTQR